jgi:hypothetical protein
MRFRAAGWGLVFALASASGSHAANLIKDGGFEKPPSPSGYFNTYAIGQKIEQWIVVGTSGNVATVNNFNEGGVLWTAHRGKAFLDLTGTCDCGANSGVAQTVKTVPGTTYQLTFWVVNTVIPGQGDTSTVDVYNGSTLLIAAENTAGQGSTKEVWKKFQVSFMATAATTTLSFINGDPPGDEQDGLDDVSLVTQ